MFDFFNRNSQKYDFYFGIQKTAEVMHQLNAQKYLYLENLLSKEEKKVFASLNIEKRKVEWLSGRMAAKKAFIHFQKGNFKQILESEISILNRQNRAPFILEFPELNISISHSSEYAVAVITQSKIGVDIEKIEPRPISLIEYFCSPNERIMLKNLRNESIKTHSLLTKYWTRKEAISKYVQLGAKINFKKIDTIADTFYNNCISEDMIKLVSGQFNNYCMTLAI